MYDIYKNNFYGKFLKNIIQLKIIKWYNNCIDVIGSFCIYLYYINYIFFIRSNLLDDLGGWLM